MADDGNGPHGIVAAVDLSSADAHDQLTRHGEAANFRGVRDQSATAPWDDPNFLRGYAELGRRNLLCSLNILWPDMAAAARLAQRHPETTLILDHMGFPQERTDEYFASWRGGLRELAAAESVICKISEIGIIEPGWTTESIRRWVLSCVEIFGVQRCVFGTNWPVDRLYGTYSEIVTAYRDVIGELTPSEQQALLVDNAERIFRI